MLRIDWKSPDRPPFIVAAALVAFAGFIVWDGLGPGATAPSPMTLVWAAVLLVAVVGLLFRRNWARLLVFVLAGLAWIGWIWIIAQIVLAGWPERDLLKSAISLLPGTALLAFWAVVAFAVRGRFPSRRRPAA